METTSFIRMQRSSTATTPRTRPHRAATGFMRHCPSSVRLRGGDVQLAARSPGSGSCGPVGLGYGGRRVGHEPVEEAAQGRELVGGEAGAETLVEPDDGGEQPVEDGATG